MKTKTGANVDAPKGLGCSCTNSGTRRFTFVKNPMRSHECGNIGMLLRQKEHIRDNVLQRYYASIMESYFLFEYSMFLKMHC